MPESMSPDSVRSNVLSRSDEIAFELQAKTPNAAQPANANRQKFFAVTDPVGIQTFGLPTHRRFDELGALLPISRPQDSRIGKLPKAAENENDSTTASDLMP